MLQFDVVYVQHHVGVHGVDLVGIQAGGNGIRNRVVGLGGHLQLQLVGLPVQQVIQCHRFTFAVG